MKTTIVNLIVVTALSFSGAALAAGETGSKVQPAAAKPAAPASAVPPAPVQSPQPAAKTTAPAKPAEAKPPRSKTLDLRHCLDLENDAAIAKCAGE